MCILYIAVQTNVEITIYIRLNLYIVLSLVENTTIRGHAFHITVSFYNYY